MTRVSSVSLLSKFCRSILLTIPSAASGWSAKRKAVSQLNHAHICTLHDIGNQNGIVFLVMEYLEGETLADRLTRGALSLEE